jgi:hypothetical protein
MSRFDDAVGAAVAAEERRGRSALSWWDLDEIRERLFEAWLAERRFADLVAHALEAYETEGGHASCVVLSAGMREAGEDRLIHRLWKGLIASRTHAFWQAWPGAGEGHVGSLRDAAVRRAAALEAMAEYYNNLWHLGLPEEMERVREEMVRLHEGRRAAPLPADPRRMSPELFWALIGGARAGAGSAGEMAARLTTALAAFRPAEIRKFNKLLSERLAQLQSWDLWAFAYLVRGGCSDDAFDYFRAWVVAQGEAAFAAALEGPLPLLDAADRVWDLQCEELLTVAEDAHLERAGTALPAGRAAKVRMHGTPWEERELEARYPELCRRLAPAPAG